MNRRNTRELNQGTGTPRPATCAGLVASGAPGGDRGEEPGQTQGVAHPSWLWVGLLWLCCAAMGCGEASSGLQTPGPVGPRSQPLRILATTSQVADVARSIAGSAARVEALMGPGVDPHLYQPTLGDQRRLREADLVLYNGLHLEGKMTEIFESLAESKRVVALSSEIPPEQLLQSDDSAGQPDPHIWFDIALWKLAAQTVVAQLCELDPANSPGYRERGATYLMDLERAHQECLQRVEQLPPARRVLLTSHDAFAYLGRAYGFEVVGLQGLSTESEAGLRRLTECVDLVKSRQVRAIFPETSVSRSAIERVATDSGARLGPELFSDALGPADGPAGTVAGMLRTNIELVVEALSGEAK